jgi:predicted HAD superfamily Cof-like phosphohydrolase
MYDDDSAVIDTLLERYSNQLVENGKLRAQVDELQLASTRDVMARRASLRGMVRWFNATVGIATPDSPTWPDIETIQLRKALIAEEFDELCEAISDGDIVSVADALADLQYVIEGAFLAFGIDSGPVLAEVHRSNLTKTGAPRDPLGKVTKGEHYSPPDIVSVLKSQGLTRRGV